MRAVLRTWVTLFSFAACGLDTVGEVGNSPADSGSPKDAAHDVGQPAPDVAPPTDAAHPTDATSRADAREASSDVRATSDASDAAPLGEAGTTETMRVTFYGWDDNMPPGTAIAYPMSGGYPTVHDAAGGTGTYADPITFASDKSELPIGTVVYAPFIEKYLVMEDDCPPCDMEWSKKPMMWHINVWMNSDGTEMRGALTACEAGWMEGSTPIEIDPPPGRLVTTTPLFDPATNTCRSTP